jgi:glycosyl transferase family 87
VALALYVVLGALFIHDWDGYVFETSVRDFFQGRSPYTVAEHAPYYSYLNPTDHHPQWYAYPPLPLLAMAATFSPAVVLPLPAIVERVLIKVPIILGTLALAYVCGRWTRHLGRDEATVARVERLLLFNPFIVLVGPVWGMTDTGLMALLLGGALSLEQGRPRQAGVLFGLSVLIKPFPLLIALPLLAYYAHRLGWRPVLRVATTGLPVVAAICLPFVLDDARAFWGQVVDMHLRRDPQGLTIWSVGGLAENHPGLVSVLSIGAIAGSLLVLSVLAPRLRGPNAPILIVLAASSQILLWNRVVNEQYLVMAIAPLLLLYGSGQLTTRFETRAARIVPHLFAVITAVRGFHFVRFIPPDVEWVLFGTRDATVLANRIRNLFDWGWNDVRFPEQGSALLVALLLVLLAAIGWRILSQNLPGRAQAPAPVRRWGSHASAFGCLALLALGSMPLVSPEAVVFEEPHPLPVNPRVGAFYYLWWDNPAHDPNLAAPYGNWWQASEFPALGFYTQTRGVARLHAQMMRENGIDVAVVSYHTGEYNRYRTFQEEAQQEGVLVAPLMELNQVYDQSINRPFNWSRQPEKHASYSLSDHTRQEIADYVLELKTSLKMPNAYRVDGRPAIFFYDSYVSDVGFRIEEREDLARMLLATKSIEELRYLFNDPALEPTVQDLLRYYPTVDGRRAQEIEDGGDYLGAASYRDSSFYNGFNYDNNNGTWPDHPKATLRLSAPWREAHFDLHREWWRLLREALEAELGPVFLVSGDAWNEQAGFYAGTIKDIENLEVFDGSFIYSPSFAWGVQPRDPDHRHYDDYFTLWTYRNLWLTSFANGMDRYSSFGIAPAYDDTHLVTRNNPRHNISFTIPAEHNGTRTYDRAWSSVLRAPPTLSIVATFNEFFEGSAVEPSREYGGAFLNATGAYHARLDALARGSPRVLAVVHERASRLQYVNYSETDRPHYWGLKLIAAAGDLYGGASLEAVDGYQEDYLDGLEPPDLLLIDGARDDYNLSEPVLDRLHAWVDEGVPTLIIGREVAAPLRELVPDDCAYGGLVRLGEAVTGEEAVVPSNSTHDDQVDHGDTLRAGSGNDTGVLLLDGAAHGMGVRVGQRCPGAALAFTTIKPWLPLDDKSTALDWASRTCLSTVLEALLPEVAPPSATDPATCRVV